MLFQLTKPAALGSCSYADVHSSVCMDAEHREETASELTQDFFSYFNFNNLYKTENKPASVTKEPRFKLQKNAEHLSHTMNHLCDFYLHQQPNALRRRRFTDVTSQQEPLHCFSPRGPNTRSLQVLSPGEPQVSSGDTSLNHQCTEERLQLFVVQSLPKTELRDYFQRQSNLV